MAAMMYHVQADWDPEADVWVATSNDVPGLATEASTIETLTEKLRTIIPELLKANQLVFFSAARVRGYDRVYAKLATGTLLSFARLRRCNLILSISWRVSAVK